MPGSEPEIGTCSSEVTAVEHDICEATESVTQISVTDVNDVTALESVSGVHVNTILVLGSTMVGVDSSTTSSECSINYSDSSATRSPTVHSYCATLDDESEELINTPVLNGTTLPNTGLDKTLDQSDSLRNTRDIAESDETHQSKHSSQTVALEFPEKLEAFSTNSLNSDTRNENEGDNNLNGLKRASTPVLFQEIIIIDNLTEGTQNKDERSTMIEQNPLNFQFNKDSSIGSCIEGYCGISSQKVEHRVFRFGGTAPSQKSGTLEPLTEYPNRVYIKPNRKLPLLYDLQLTKQLWNQLPQYPQSQQLPPYYLPQLPQLLPPQLMRLNPDTLSISTPALRHKSSFLHKRPQTSSSDEASLWMNCDLGSPQSKQAKLLQTSENSFTNCSPVHDKQTTPTRTSTSETFSDHEIKQLEMSYVEPTFDFDIINTSQNQQVIFNNKEQAKVSYYSPQVYDDNIYTTAPWFVTGTPQRSTESLLYVNETTQFVTGTSPLAGTSQSVSEMLQYVTLLSERYGCESTVEGKLKETVLESIFSTEWQPLNDLGYDESWYNESLTSCSGNATISPLNLLPMYVPQESPSSPIDYTNSPSSPIDYTYSPSSPIDYTYNPSSSIQVNSEPHETALTLACVAGNTGLVSVLLSHGANIEYKDCDGFTPLIHACMEGHTAVVDWLLAAGANIEAQCWKNMDSPLGYACMEDHCDVVLNLLRHGANIEHRNSSNFTPLCIASSGGFVDVIKLLIEWKADKNPCRDDSEWDVTPLMIAARKGHVAAVEVFLDSGCSVNMQMKSDGHTALTVACSEGYPDLVKLLVSRKANMDVRSKTGLTPLMEAALRGHTVVGRILLDARADISNHFVQSTRDTALTIAADNGHVQFVELLLKMGAIIDTKNKKGNSALWLACAEGHVDVVQCLVEYNADVESQDSKRVTCLMAAFKNGHVEVLQTLLKFVQHFPVDRECMQFIETVKDAQLRQKCLQCLALIRSARNELAAKAIRNADNLLKQLELETKQKEEKRAALARKKLEKRRKKKDTQCRDVDSNALNVVDVEDENNDRTVCAVVIMSDHLNTVSLSSLTSNETEKNVSVFVTEKMQKHSLNKHKSGMKCIENKKNESTLSSAKSSANTSASTASSILGDKTKNAGQTEQGSKCVYLDPTSQSEMKEDLLPQAISHTELNRSRLEFSKRTSNAELDEFESIPDDEENLIFFANSFAQKNDRKKKKLHSHVQQVVEAKMLRENNIQAYATGPSVTVKKPEKGSSGSKMILVRSHAISRVIGRNGKNFKHICKMSGARISLDIEKCHPDGVASITGSKEAVSIAKKLLNEFIDNEFNDNIREDLTLSNVDVRSVVTVTHASTCVYSSRTNVQKNCFTAWPTLPCATTTAVDSIPISTSTTHCLLSSAHQFKNLKDTIHQIPTENKILLNKSFASNSFRTQEDNQVNKAIGFDGPKQVRSFPLSAFTSTTLIAKPKKLRRKCKVEEVNSILHDASVNLLVNKSENYEFSVPSTVSISRKATETKETQSLTELLSFSYSKSSVVVPIAKPLNSNTLSSLTSQCPKKQYLKTHPDNIIQPDVLNDNLLEYGHSKWSFSPVSKLQKDYPIGCESILDFANYTVASPFHCVNNKSCVLLHDDTNAKNDTSLSKNSSCGVLPESDSLVTVMSPSTDNMTPMIFNQAQRNSFFQSESDKTFECPLGLLMPYYTEELPSQENSSTGLNDTGSNKSSRPSYSDNMLHKSEKKSRALSHINSKRAFDRCINSIENNSIKKNISESKTVKTVSPTHCHSRHSALVSTNETVSSPVTIASTGNKLTFADPETTLPNIRISENVDRWNLNTPISSVLSGALIQVNTSDSLKNISAILFDISQKSKLNPRAPAFTSKYALSGDMLNKHRPVALNNQVGANKDFPLINQWNRNKLSSEEAVRTSGAMFRPSEKITFQSYMNGSKGMSGRGKKNEPIKSSNLGEQIRNIPLIYSRAIRGRTNSPTNVNELSLRNVVGPCTVSSNDSLKNLAALMNPGLVCSYLDVLGIDNVSTSRDRLTSISQWPESRLSIVIGNEISSGGNAGLNSKSPSPVVLNAVKTALTPGCLDWRNSRDPLSSLGELDCFTSAFRSANYTGETIDSKISLGLMSTANIVASNMTIANSLYYSSIPPPICYSSYQSQRHKKGGCLKSQRSNLYVIPERRQHFNLSPQKSNETQSNVMPYNSYLTTHWNRNSIDNAISSDSDNWRNFMTNLSPSKSDDDPVVRKMLSKKSNQSSVKRKQESNIEYSNNSISESTLLSYDFENDTPSLLSRGSFPCSTAPSLTSAGSFYCFTASSLRSTGSFPCSTAPSLTSAGSFPCSTIPSFRSTGSFPCSTIPSFRSAGSLQCSTASSLWSEGSFPCLTVSSLRPTGLIPCSNTSSVWSEGFIPCSTASSPLSERLIHFSTASSVRSEGLISCSTALPRYFDGLIPCSTTSSVWSKGLISCSTASSPWCDELIPYFTSSPPGCDGLIPCSTTSPPWSDGLIPCSTASSVWPEGLIPGSLKPSVWSEGSIHGSIEPSPLSRSTKEVEGNHTARHDDIDLINLSDTFYDTPTNNAASSLESSFSLLSLSEDL